MSIKLPRVCTGKIDPSNGYGQRHLDATPRFPSPKMGSWHITHPSWFTGNLIAAKELDSEEMRSSLCLASWDWLVWVGPWIRCVFFVDNLTRAFFNVCWPFGMVPVSRTSKAFQDVLGNQKLTFTSFHVALVICMWSCCATSIIFVGTMAWEVLVRNIGKGTEKKWPILLAMGGRSFGSSNLTTSVVTSMTWFRSNTSAHQDSAEL